MNVQQNEYIEHEVKLRVHDEKFNLLEKALSRIDSDISKLDSKLDTQFKWVLGMVVTFFGGIILHMAHII